MTDTSQRTVSDAGPSTPYPVSRRPPDHLNSTGCRMEFSDGKGRGVYASRALPTQTLVEISPVLLFSKYEYEEHGKYTALDHYTFKQAFKWPDGRIALALGLGSIFNHSQSPNVSFMIDTETESIRYVTTRAILPNEELCIFYGHKLWFDPVDPDDGWGGLSNPHNDDPEEVKPSEFEFGRWHLLDGDPNEIIPEDQLPFTRIKLTPDDEEEEELGTIRTEQAWAVDIPEQRHIATMLKWLRQSGLEDISLSHLKRIRKSNSSSALLLATLSSCPIPPALPDGLNLSPPYLVAVPRYPALTMTSLRLKTTLWPTVYAPRRKGELEEWSRGRVRWAWDSMKTVVKEAKLAGEEDDLPIVAYVPIPYDNETKVATQLRVPILAHDTRKSASHPLRHAVLNVVRKVAAYRASSGNDSESIPSADVLVGSSSLSTTDTSVDEEDASQLSGRNGAHYLLTSLTLFISHEPCIMCSMALLHSRVKEIFYLIPMEKTGGCGGVACVPKLPGVNHRYGISGWKLGEGGLRLEGLELSQSIDA